MRLTTRTPQQLHSWLKVASALFEDSAPSASLDCLKARAAPTHPGAPPEPLGSLRWPQQLASDRPKVEESPLSTARRRGWRGSSARRSATPSGTPSSLKMPPALPDDTGPSASLSRSEARRGLRSPAQALAPKGRGCSTCNRQVPE